MRKISRKRYEEALGIVRRYEEQNRKSFEKGSFTINDLKILTFSINVPKLTADVFDDEYCGVLYQEINDRIGGCEWANVDDQGLLNIAFSSAIISDDQIEATLAALNSLD